LGPVRPNPTLTTRCLSRPVSLAPSLLPRPSCPTWFLRQRRFMAPQPRLAQSTPTQTSRSGRGSPSLQPGSGQSAPRRPNACTRRGQATPAPAAAPHSPSVPVLHGPTAGAAHKTHRYTGFCSLCPYGLDAFWRGSPACLGIRTVPGCSIFTPPRSIGPRPDHAATTKRGPPGGMPEGARSLASARAPSMRPRQSVALPRCPGSARCAPLALAPFWAGFSRSAHHRRSTRGR